MVNQICTLLSKLEKTVEKMEIELLECKKIIQLIENTYVEGSENANKTKTRTSKTTVVSPSIDRNLIVEKIEAEFKENKFDTLTWLVKSKITKDEIINIFHEKGIIIAKSTNKNKISDEVQRILSNRYSFSRT